MIFDGLNIAASSLKTHQKAMDVVSHNIANVNTEGYSRQAPSIVTVTPDSLGSLSFGRGVELQSVQRLVDPIINDSLLKNGEQQAFWSTVNAGLNTVENVFGSLQSTGLASALDEFFLAWQQLANNPQDTAQKINVRERSTIIASNLNNMRQQLSDEQSNLNIEIDNSIVQVNRLLDNISDLTAQINRQEGSLQGSTGMANDLRDQRDQATRNLAKLIPIRKVETGDNGFLIQSTSGDLLVQDNVSRHLSRGTIAASGFAKIEIAETGVTISGVTGGGEIGGLIELRDNKLNGYIQDIDSIATNLIFSVNQVHSSGSSGNNISSFTAGQPGNATLALDDAAQTAPFAGKIQNGSFKVHVYNAAGTASPAGGTAINITAGTTTMNNVVTDLNAITGITASIDSTGHLIISADTGNTVALSDDSSNMLAAFELNAFFHGADAGSLSLSASIQSNAVDINTGKVNSATSAILSGDNSSALAILTLQDTAMSVDGTASASLYSRTSTLSTIYGTDVSSADQQDRYRSAEADSLNSQRQAISGVNIDEELVSMIKFQRAYEAAAKIISTTNQMLDSLLGMIR